MNRLLIGIASVFLFSACAHVSKKACLEKDWRAVGLADGNSGFAFKDMTKVAESCRRFEMLNPPEKEYELGYMQGLKTYCYSWNEKGVKDGASGQFRLNMQKPDLMCARIEMPTAPSASYESGYTLGLSQYCTAELGLAFGARGEVIPHVCSQKGSSFPLLVDSWNKGVKNFCVADLGRAAASDGREPNPVCEKAKHPTYFKGFEQGAKSYCTDARVAFQRAKRGTSAFEHCPANLAIAFDEAYQEGRRVRANIDRLNTEVNTLDGRIAGLKLTWSSTDSSIANHRYQMARLNGELSSKRSDIYRLESDISWTLNGNSNYDLGSLERRLRDERDRVAQIEREKSNITDLELPRLYNRQTQVNFEITQLELRKSNLKQEIALLDAKEYYPSR